MIDKGQNRTTSMRSLLLFALFLVFVHYSEAGCYALANDPGKAGCRAKNGTTLRDGEQMRFEGDCLDCNCNGNILSCCGYGYYAGAFNVPGCKVTVDDDGCSMKIVDPIDNTKPCKPSIVSIVRK